MDLIQIHNVELSLNLEEVISLIKHFNSAISLSFSYIY
jgi:hypothetical protein